MSFDYLQYPVESFITKNFGKNSVQKIKADNTALINLCEINTISKIENLKEEWKRLFLRSQELTPFQSWEWNYAVIKEFSSSEKIKIVVGYNADNEVVGIAPFKITNQKLTGIKIMELIGNKSSDYLDFLVEQEYKYTFINSLFDLIKNSTDWTILNLINLREETRNLIQHTLPFEILPQDVCPCVYLPGTMKEYENEVHKRELKSIKRQLRKLLPKNRLEYIVKDSSESLKEDVDVFINLHQKRHNSKGERGRFFTETRKENFHDISKLLYEAGILQIEMLKIDSQIAAINYILVWNNRKYNYLSGMNPAFANFKPGKILIYYMINDAINKGCNLFDFLQGAEKYKYFWTNEEIQLYSAVYSRSTICLFLWKDVLTLRNRIKRSTLLKRYYKTFCRIFCRKFSEE